METEDQKTRLIAQQNADTLPPPRSLAELDTRDLRVLFDEWTRDMRDALDDALRARATHDQQMTQLDGRIMTMGTSLANLEQSINDLAGKVQGLVGVNGPAAQQPAPGSAQAVISALLPEVKDFLEKVLDRFRPVPGSVPSPIPPQPTDGRGKGGGGAGGGGRSGGKRPQNLDGEDLDIDEGWSVMIGDVEEEGSGSPGDRIGRGTNRPPSRSPRNTIVDQSEELVAHEKFRQKLIDAKYSDETINRLTNLVAVLDRIEDENELRKYLGELRDHGADDDVVRLMRRLLKRYLGLN